MTEFTHNENDDLMESICIHAIVHSIIHAPHSNDPQTTWVSIENVNRIVFDLSVL